MLSSGMDPTRPPGPPSMGPRGMTPPRGPGPMGPGGPIGPYGPMRGPPPPGPMPPMGGPGGPGGRPPWPPSSAVITLDIQMNETILLKTIISCFLIIESHLVKFNYSPECRLFMEEVHPPVVLQDLAQAHRSCPALKIQTRHLVIICIQ